MRRGEDDLRLDGTLATALWFVMLPRPECACEARSSSSDSDNVLKQKNSFNLNLQTYMRVGVESGLEIVPQVSALVCAILGLHEHDHTRITHRFRRVHRHCGGPVVRRRR